MANSTTKTYLVVGLLLGLMFIWPIPHTIAARNILILVSVLVLARISVRHKDRVAGLRPPAAPLALFAVLTVWLLLEALFVSNETAWALGELNGQWATAIVASAIGVLSVRFLVASRLDVRKWLLLIIIAPLVAHVLFTAGWALFDWWRSGVLPDRFAGLTGGPDKASYLTNFALSLLVAEGVFRLQHRRKVLPIGNGILLLLFGAGLFTVYLERMRNGGAALAIMLLVALALFVLVRPTRRVKGLIIGTIAGLLVLVSIGGMVERDPRWATFTETAKLAWDTQHHLAWLNPHKYPYPKLANGQRVDPSAYLRIAWFKEGALLVLEHPLGIGFGRNAFGHGLMQKYGQGRGHSHSGLLDLTIGGGIPAAVLWLLFIASLLAAGLSRYRSSYSYAALALVLVTTDYGSRMLVDSIIRDHMLQQFMFVVGALATLMVWEGRREAGDG